MTLRQAAEDLWTSGNAHQRSPGSERGATVLVSWRAPDAPPAPDTGGSTCDQCFMLFGFSLENLAKGVIICRDPKRVNRSYLESWQQKGHKLAELFDWAGIPITSVERDVLSRASRTITWKGRYPVPMFFSETEPHRDPMVNYLAISNIWPADEYARLVALYDKADAALLKAAQETPALPPDYDFT